MKVMRHNPKLKNKRAGSKGFTLTEVLLVVALLGIISAVMFVNVIAIKKSMEQKELDGFAEEIFVAAQNHLSTYGSSNLKNLYDTKKDDTGAEAILGTKEPAEENEDGVMIESNRDFVSVKGDSFTDEDASSSSINVLTIMLPFASIDETVRTGGNFFIRYEATTGTVLDVLYSKEYKFDSDRTYSQLKGLFGDSKKEARRNYAGGMLGYYGGAKAYPDTADEISDPSLSVKNGNTLEATVTDTNTYATGKGYNLSLVIKGMSSGAQANIPLVKNGSNISVSDRGYIKIVSEDGAKKYTVTLDDITRQRMNFASIAKSWEGVNGYLADNSKKFVPGENLKIYAISYNSSALTNVGESVKKKTNSLFAKMQDVTDGNSISGTVTKTVFITKMRHLENLDDEISMFDYDYQNGTEKPLRATAVMQGANLDWNGFKSDTGSEGEIYGGNNGNRISATYYPIQPTWLHSYDGNSYRISYITTTASTYAGLFSAINWDDTFKVSNLELANFSVTAGVSGQAYAGALAGYVSGTGVRITGVAAYNDLKKDITKYPKIKGQDAGGLVGGTTGVTLNYCTAAVLVDGTNNAGGLIGLAASTNFNGCYSGGFTKDAKYVTKTGGDFNVMSSSGNAGGLVGNLTNSSNISASYATSSAYSSAENGNVGGLVGSVAGVTTNGYIRGCYSIGAVGGASGAVGNFVGNYGSHNYITYTGDYFLNNVTVSEVTNPEGVEGVTVVSGESSTNLVPDSLKTAYAYDAALARKYSGKYSFRTIDQLVGATTDELPVFAKIHYGDWTLPEVEETRFYVQNTDKLTLFMPVGITSELGDDFNCTFTLSVTGKTSKNSRYFKVTFDKSKPENERVKLTEAGQSTTPNGTINFKPVASDDPSAELYGYSVPILGTVDKSVTEGNGSENIYTYVTLNMDDITSVGQHFNELFATGENNLLPGEGLTVRVAQLETSTVSGINGKSPRGVSTNSLFADNSSGNDMRIEYIRHLQNLESDISAIGNDTSSDVYAQRAAVGRNISWAEFLNETGNVNTIYSSNSSQVITNSFFGISNGTLGTLDGANYSIDGLPLMDARFDGQENPADAALFTNVITGMTINNLRLTNYTANSSAGNAAAFISSVTGDQNVILETVLAEGANATITAAGEGKVAGGLIGGISTSGSVSINNSAASSYIYAGGDAGGLVGQITGTGTLSIESSYIGGHTDNGAYRSDAYDYSADIRGRWNVYSTGGSVGGVIGSIDSNVGAVRVGKTFSAASARTIAGDDVASAGDVVGRNNGTNVTIGYVENEKAHPVYTIAPVDGVATYSIADHGAPASIDGSDPGHEGSYTKTGEPRGAFAGTSANLINNSYTYYIPEIYDNYSELQYYKNVGSDSEGATYEIAKLSNIATIGGGNEGDAKLTSPVSQAYFSDGTEDNMIAARNHLDTMQDGSFMYDTTNAGYEYPFSMWTRFSFDRTEGIYFYGDWEPVQSAQSEIYTVKYVYRIGEDTETTLIKEQVIPFTRGYDTVVAPPAPPYVEIGQFTNWTWGDGKSSDQPYANITITDRDLDSAVTVEDPVTHEITHVLTVTANFKLEENTCLVKFFYAGNRSAYPDFNETGNPYPEYPEYSEATTNLYTQIGSTQKVTSGQTVAQAALRVPSRNIGGYRFVGWFTADGTQIDFADSYVINENITVYAKYEKISYYTVTVDFVYDMGDYTAHLNNIPQYRIGDTGQYQLQQKSGERFDKTIRLPAVGASTGQAVTPTIKELTYTGDDGEEHDAVTDGKGSINENEGKFTLNTDKETHYTMVYNGLPDEGEVEYYKVVYEMHNTAPNSSVPVYIGSEQYDLAYEDGSKYNYDGLVFDENENTSFVYSPYSKSSGGRVDGKVGTTDLSKACVFRTPTNTIPDVAPREFIPGFKDPVSTDTEYKLPGEGDGTEANPYILHIHYYRETYVLTYKSGGGTYIEPEEYKYGQPITAPTNPQRTGYSFNGWTWTKTGEEGANAGLPANMPEYNVTATAGWTGTNTTYKVVYWFENADDDEYVVDTSIMPIIQKTGRTGSTPTVTNQEKKVPDSYKKIFDDRNNYVRDDASDKVIEANGSTVVNVYFSRQMYTLKFHRKLKIDNSDYDRTYYGLVNDGFVELTSRYVVSYMLSTSNSEYSAHTGDVYFISGGTTSNPTYSRTSSYEYGDGRTYYRRERHLSWSGWVYYYYELYWYPVPMSDGYNYVDDDGNITEYTGNRYSSNNVNTARGSWPIDENITITAKAGADIHDKWPLTLQGGASWYVSDSGNVFVSLMTSMPNQNMDYYEYISSGNNRLYTYYRIQNVDGSNTFDEVYTDAPFYGSGGESTTADDYFPIKGFKVNANSSSDASSISRTAGADPDAVSDSRFEKSARIGSSYQGGSLTFYYLRKQYDLTFYDGGSQLSTGKVYYEADISNILHTRGHDTNYKVGETTKDIGGQTHYFAGWFTNPECAGEPYNFTNKKMPDSSLLFYAKWEKERFEVKFNPNGVDTEGNTITGANMSGEEELSVYAGDSVDSIIADASGELLPDYIPTLDGYKFDDWYYKDGNTEKHFISSQAINRNYNKVGDDDKRIYAKWIKIEETQKADVTIKSYYMDNGTRVELDSEIKQGDVGLPFRVKSETREGFYARNLSKSIIVDADSANNLIEFEYVPIAAWHYKINYYIDYRNLADKVDWMGNAHGINFNNDSFEVLYDTVEKDAFSHYSLVAFEVPEGLDDHYKFSQYSYDEDESGTITADEKGTDIVVIVHPDNEHKTAEINFYMEPDVSTIGLEDRYEVYNGESKYREQEKHNGLCLPSEAGSGYTNKAPKDGSTVEVTNYYQYFDGSNTGTELSGNDKLIDAGTYLMRGYVVAKVTDKNGVVKNYLLWRSDNNDFRYLYVDKRSITLMSASAKSTYSAGNVLRDDRVFAIYDDGHNTIQYDSLGNPIAGTYSAGFVNGDGANYVFAVDAFRKTVGTSKNVFDYSLKNGTKSSNYNISKKYGTLTVTD